MSLIETKLQNWRIKAPRLDKNMYRPQNYGALDFFIGQSNLPYGILTPELKAKAEVSMGNTIQMPVIAYDGDVQVSNVRTCTIEDNENTSALVSLVFATYQVGFTMVPAAYTNNEIGYEQDFGRKMEKVSRALANALDTAAIAALEANKTEVFGNLLYYSESGDSVQVAWDLRTEIFGDLNPMMRANDYNGAIHIIGNTGVDSQLRKLAEHGLYNDVNKQLEYGDKILHFTNNLTNEDGIFGTFYAVEDGNVGMLTRVDREAARGASANGHEWGKTRLPYIDLNVGYHYYTAVGDQSGIVGAATADLTCGVKEYYGFSVDVAFIVAYNSSTSTIAQPIIKGEILKSAQTNVMAKPIYVTNDEDSPVPTKEVTEAAG